MRGLSVRDVLAALAATLVLAAFGLCVFHLFKGHWLSSIGFALAGILAGLFWLPGIMSSGDAPPEWKSWATVASAIAVFAVVYEHRAFDMTRQTAHFEATDGFANMAIHCPTGGGGSLDALAQKGLMACWTEDQFAMMDAIGEFQKAQYLGPTLSIADGVHSATKKQPVDRCAAAFLVARPLCPSAFSSVSKRSIAVLEAEP